MEEKRQEWLVVLVSVRAGGQIPKTDKKYFYFIFIY